MKADWTKIVGKKERLFFEYYDNTAHYYVVMKCEEERLEKGAPPNDQVVLFADGAEMTINQVVNTIIAASRFISMYSTPWIRVGSRSSRSHIALWKDATSWIGREAKGRSQSYRLPLRQ